MSDPSRLVNMEQGQALRMLRASQDVPPPPAGAVEQTLLGLGVGAPTTSAVTALSIVKWVTLGMVVGAAASASIVGQQGSPETPAVNQPAVSRPPAAASFVSPLVQLEPRPSVSRSTPAPPVAAPSPIPSPTRSGGPSALSVETAQLDRVRSAIAAGQASNALTLLDEYDARFSAGQLVPEAALLRVRALTAAGRSEAARALALDLLRGSPDAELAARIREAAGLGAL
jgi:hypothetical protein